MAESAQQTTPRTPLSRERVLRTAIELADEGGIEALSMRRLAKELGVEAMSLYNHVANKNDLLDAMVDLVIEEIELPSTDDWKTALRENTISARDVYIRHRWASGLSLKRQAGGDASFRRGDWLLRTLREAGFSKHTVYHAYHVLDAYVLGFTSMQLSFPYKGEELAGLAEQFMKTFPSDDYPDLAEHIREHMQPDHGDEPGFEFGLRLLLDSLERLRDET